ncbi:GntR family transcriptional regulator [Saccharomonospora sp. NB11]|jgi:DNA-binding GntR family transcriptional regulator|uniref:GntR family transcriptional regulator n=1 Tax=Saccharomonospora sp. NB11 TaxID=1642298 RepID=UPI0018D0DD9B|nr:GntR family transcriptional regulator [Saccharomonospora sp. NB11]
MLADIAPVSRESTASIIARQLRDAIMNGALPPGTQLGETELASRFEVSRGPLREAMQRLVSEGLLRSEPHRGLFVIDLEPDDVHDIYWARSAIERAAAQRVVRGPHRHDVVARLTESVTAMAEADELDDPAALIEADLAFHETLIESSGSRRLVRMASTLLIETRMCLSALQNTYQRNSQGADERIAEHNRIIEALRDGDEESLIALLEAHMEDAVRRLAPDKTLVTPADN